ncbi:MAG: VCBS repeat-containing protein, partial [Candidatus Latescibacterota bacterium]
MKGKPALLLLIMLSTADQAQSITWSFEAANDDQGWSVRESLLLSTGISSELEELRSEVADGVWRIYPPSDPGDRVPSIELVSPRLSLDSSLFDRLTVRFRLIPSQPGIGILQLGWVNTYNRSTKQYTVPNPYTGIDQLFGLGNPLIFTSDWQQAAIADLRSRRLEVYNRVFDLTWEDVLYDVRIHIELPAWPEVIEVDQIVLTGMGEELHGELPPPQASAVPMAGELFSLPVFNPFGTQRLYEEAFLGDVDGDGDRDLLSTCGIGFGDGWLMALNDGQGHFGPECQVQEVKDGAFLRAADLNNDGRLEVLVRGSSLTDFRYLQYEPEEGWSEIQRFSGMSPFGFGDADEDGDIDLWMIENKTISGMMNAVLWLLRNDGNGMLATPVPADQDLTAAGWGPNRMVQDYRPGAILWYNLQTGGSGYLVTYYEEETGRRQEGLAYASTTTTPIRYIGDFDLDGDVDLILSSSPEDTSFFGLTLAINTGAGSFAFIPWQKDLDIRGEVLLTDLNEDGVLDPVFVDGNERDPAVIVHLGAKAGLPVLEGRYPLAGLGGTVVGDDVDNDEDVDLVVLERNVGAQGGVHVLLNRLHDQQTAVAEERTTTLPVTPALSPAYPNPFNAATVIPVSLPVDAAHISLMVYDLLGQPVRRL